MHNTYHLLDRADTHTTPRTRVLFFAFLYHPFVHFPPIQSLGIFFTKDPQKIRALFLGEEDTAAFTAHTLECRDTRLEVSDVVYRRAIINVLYMCVCVFVCVFHISKLTLFASTHKYSEFKWAPFCPSEEYISYVSYYI